MSHEQQPFVAGDPPTRYRTSVVIDAPPEHVFRFWVEAGRLTQWIGRRADIDPRPGGRFRFEIAPDEWCSGEYLELDPPRRVVVSWGWESGRIAVPPGSTRVEVGFSEMDGKTHVELVHHGLRGDACRLHEDGWPRFMERLDGAARGVVHDTDPATESPELARARLEQS